MKLADALSLPTPRARAAALHRRLIPLAEGLRSDALQLEAQELWLAPRWAGEVSNGGHRHFWSSAAGDRSRRWSGVLA